MNIILADPVAYEIFNELQDQEFILHLCEVRNFPKILVALFCGSIGDGKKKCSKLTPDLHLRAKRNFDRK